MPSTAQVTAVFEEPVTVAVMSWVPEGLRVTDGAGLRATATDDVLAAWTVTTVEALWAGAATLVADTV
jgi:hypothetical protein